MQFSLEELKNLLKTLEAGGVAEFEYQDEKFRVKVGSRARCSGRRRSGPARRALGPIGSPAPVAARAGRRERRGGHVAVRRHVLPRALARRPNFVEVGSVVSTVRRSASSRR